jgi:Protein of unknown function (DUF2786)
MPEPTTERDRIKQKVTKLLNMTVDRGATEHEAMQAAEQAAKLMAHYDIEASELSIRSSRAIKKTAVVRKYGSLNIAGPCAWHVAQACDCMFWHDTGIDPRDADLPPVWQRLEPVVVFFGLPADAELAAYQFYLISNIISAHIDTYKESEDYRREVEAGVNRRTAITSFIKGMEEAINRKLDTMRDAKHQAVQQATGRSLVLVKEEQIKEDFAATGIKLVSGGGSYRGAGSSGAAASGRAAGGRVSLSSGVGAGRSAGSLR